MRTEILISNWKKGNSNNEYTTANPSYGKIFRIVNKGGLGFSDVFEDDDSKGYNDKDKTYHIFLSDSATPEQEDKISRLKNVKVVNSMAKGGLTSSIKWKKNIGDDGWSSTMENESAYDNEGGYISESGNWKIYRDGRFYERADGYENYKRDGYWIVMGMNEYGRVEDFKGEFETLSEAKKYVERWIEINPKDFAKGGLTKGKSHSKGGMPMQVKSTGQKVELEGGEGVLNKYVMSDDNTYEFEGKEMTPCQIASKLNQTDGNGVKFDCQQTKTTDMTATDKSTGFAAGGILFGIGKFGIGDVIQLNAKGKNVSSLRPYLSEHDNSTIIGINQVGGSYNVLTRTSGGTLTITTISAGELQRYFKQKKKHKDNKIQVGSIVQTNSYINDFEEVKSKVRSGVWVTEWLSGKNIGVRQERGEASMRLLNDMGFKLGTKLKIGKDEFEVIEVMGGGSDYIAIFELQNVKYPSSTIKLNINELLEGAYNVVHPSKKQIAKLKKKAQQKVDDNKSIEFADALIHKLSGYHYDLVEDTIGGLRPIFHQLKLDKNSDVNKGNLKKQLGVLIKLADNKAVKSFENGDMLNDIKLIKKAFEKIDKEIDLLSNKNRDEILLINEDIDSLVNLLPSLDKGFHATRGKALNEIDRLRKEQYELERDGLDMTTKLSRYFNAVTRPIPDFDVQNPSLLSTGLGLDPSILTDREFTQVRGYKFKRWFGDWENANETQNYNGVSKVINEETGEPLVVWHGTGGLDVAFTKFTFDRSPMNYFGKDHQYSKWYKDARKMQLPDKEALIYGVFLDIKNPIDFSEVGIDDLSESDVRDLFYVKYGIELPYSRPIEIASEKALKSMKFRPLWFYLRIAEKEWIEPLKRSGYDGFKFLEHIPDNSANMMQSIAYTCFDANQIKLAGGLNKEFSLFSKDIRMAKGGILCG